MSDCVPRYIHFKIALSARRIDSYEKFKWFIEGFWGMEKEKQVRWPDMAWIWRHLCVSFNRSRSTTNENAKSRHCIIYILYILYRQTRYMSYCAIWLVPLAIGSSSSDERPTLETLDYTIRIDIPTNLFIFRYIFFYITQTLYVHITSYPISSEKTPTKWLNVLLKSMSIQEIRKLLDNTTPKIQCLSI